jgi:hypothetical protein
MTAAQCEVRPPRRWAEALGPGLIAITFVSLIVWTWRRWTDPVVDFGRELYVPWQISMGRVLYRDIASFYGPLSQHFNALCFRVFGASMLTLECANMAILALATALIYAIARALSSKLAATACGIMFLAIFGVARLSWMANFNFITPYSHEATHGFMLALAGMFCLVRYGQSSRTLWAAGMGVCAGLVFLTKPEIFVALAGGLTVGMAGLLWNRHHASEARRAVAAAALGACIPVAMMLWFMAMQMPFSMALRGVLGAWMFVGNPELIGSKFYADSTGLGDVPGRLRRILTVMGWFAAMLVPCFILAWRMRDGSRIRRFVGVLLGVMVAGIAAALGGWRQFGAAGELLLAGIGIVAIGQAGMFWAKRNDDHVRERSAVRLGVVLFAGIMLFKMLLHTRFHQYGFVLGAMATMVLAMAILDWAPAWLEMRGRCGWAFRGVALASLLWLTFINVLLSSVNLRVSDEQLGEGGDSMMIEGRKCAVIRDAVGYLREQVPGGATLTVFPEGAMLNFLTRRPSPVPYVSFVPTDLVMFREETMLAALRAEQPDCIAIVYRPTDDLGPRAFGSDYGQHIGAWITTNYSFLHLSGAVPFSSESFGIMLLRRNDPSGEQQGTRPAH